MKETIICMVDNRDIYDINNDILLYKIFNINYNYCIRNNYKFIFFKLNKCFDNYNNERHGARGKVAILSHISKLYPNSNIGYIDSDAIFASYEQKIENVILDENIFYFWEDELGKNISMKPISGVIFINNHEKNLAYIENILSEWYSLQENRLWEQGVLQDNIFPKYRNFISIIPSWGFDFHKDSNVDNGLENKNFNWKQCRFKKTNEGQSFYHHNFKDKHYIYHFFGDLKKEKSMELILTEIYNKYNISNINVLPKSSKLISIFNDKVFGTLYTFM